MRSDANEEAPPLGLKLIILFKIAFTHYHIFVFWFIGFLVYWFIGLLVYWFFLLFLFGFGFGFGRER